MKYLKKLDEAWIDNEYEPVKYQMNHLRSFRVVNAPPRKKKKNKNGSKRNIHEGSRRS